ncbi:MAG: ABC transporter ATP-binding protein [Candidatus Aquicultorales bacterium]
MSEPILQVKDLTVEFRTSGGILRAVDDLSFELRKGEVLSIVGESGSGKTVTALSILRLLDQRAARVAAGSILYRGADILDMTERQVRELRGAKIAMIFQDPSTALNPVLTIGRQLTEGMLAHRIAPDKASAKARAIELLERVRIPKARACLADYPHRLSGGMRQRVMIAMALACGPEILVADEPTSALDVTIQGKILELLAEIQRDYGLSILLVSHDLGVVAGMTGRVVVMYAGRAVESGPADDIFHAPRMPYTWGLLDSIPQVGAELIPIKGSPPNLLGLPRGCRFRPRCDFSREICVSTDPPSVEVGPDHTAACHFSGDRGFTRRKREAIVPSTS